MFFDVQYELPKEFKKQKQISQSDKENERILRNADGFCQKHPGLVTVQGPLFKAVHTMIPDTRPPAAEGNASHELLFSFTELGSKNIDIDMSAHFQQPGCAKKGNGKKKIFADLDGPHLGALKKISGADFHTYNQYQRHEHRAPPHTP